MTSNIGQKSLKKGETEAKNLYKSQTPPPPPGGVCRDPLVEIKKSCFFVFFGKRPILHKIATCGISGVFCDKFYFSLKVLKAKLCFCSKFSKQHQQNRIIVLP